MHRSWNHPARYLVRKISRSERLFNQIKLNPLPKLNFERFIEFEIVFWSGRRHARGCIVVSSRTSVHGISGCSRLASAWQVCEKFKKWFLRHQNQIFNRIYCWQSNLIKYFLHDQVFCSLRASCARLLPPQPSWTHRNFWRRPFCVVMPSTLCSS